MGEGIARELLKSEPTINGDTQVGIPEIYRTASTQADIPWRSSLKTRSILLAMLNYNTMSWGYWKYDFVPSVSLLKWQDTRHMVHICERWTRDHNPAIQEAFFNGVGFESWRTSGAFGTESLPATGSSPGCCNRAGVQRFVGFRPLSSRRPSSSVPSQASGLRCESKTLTVVNRNDYDVDGWQLTVPAVPNARYFDLWHGVELKPEKRGN